MNKNPKRPSNIDKIISQILNPKETQVEKNARIRREISEELEYNDLVGL